MPLIEISVVILWGAVAVSGQHLQCQIWMSWFWSFMKLKPSSGTRFATLTNIRLKIIAYHQTMSSIYNWEFDSKHLSQLWFRQVSFDHILFLLTMLLTMPLTTMHLIQFWPCLFQRLSYNAHSMTGSEIWDRAKTGLDWSLPMIHCFTCCLRIECKLAVFWSYIVCNSTKLSNKYIPIVSASCAVQLSVLTILFSFHKIHFLHKICF